MWDDEFRIKDGSGDEFHMYDQQFPRRYVIRILIGLAITAIIITGLVFLSK